MLLVAMIGYAACSAQALSALAKRPATRPLEWISLGAGFLAQTIWLFERSLAARRSPLMGAQETMAFLSWGMVIFYFIVSRLRRADALKAFVFPIAFILTSIAAIMSGAPDKPQWMNHPSERALFPIHAGLILLSYAAFFVAFGASLMYIIQERNLKKKGPGLRILPPLDTSEAIGFKSTAAGFILLTFGIAAGMAWSRARSGRIWHGEPIEIISIVTWVVYLAIIQSRLSAGWGGRRAALASIIGFALVVCSLAGLRYLGGLHGLK
jgi:ABC-type transport system involved in cytochrome c biogenesis permease subunit